jgi:hypothetical protein
MKIRDIIGEEASMVVKDFKPGQSLSMVDPATDTMTVVDLKKNPTALQTGPDGKFMYDPTPDAAAPGEPKQPELKPGAQIQVDTATTEQSEDDFEAPPMPNIDDLQAGQSKDLGSGQKVTLKQDGTVEYSGSFGTYTYDNTGTAIDYRSPSFSGLTKSKDLKTGATSQRYTAGPLDVSQTKDKAGNVVKSKTTYDVGLGVMGREQEKGITATTWQDRGSNAIQSRDMVKDPAIYDRAMKQVKGTEGYAPGTALDVKNERMDESAIITALARRVAGTEAKSKTKSKEVFDIKKLAGL